MVDQAGEYVTDIEYTWGFYREISPVLLNWIAASAGHSPRPLDRDFAYLELGCGNGVTINVNGAVHPKGRFYGVDSNAQHVANSRNMATNGGLDNVKIICCGFQDLVRDHGGLPKFDFIALHGILTWIAPEHQDAVIDIIDKMLAPGGIVYASYNCYPGQWLLEPVRKIMVEYTKGMQGDSRKRAMAGVGFVEKLLKVRPRAFVRLGQVKRLVERLKTVPLPYVVHEYFNYVWYPFWFSDIADRFGRAGLNYIGSARLQRNIADLNLRDAELKVLAPIQDPIKRQQVQDIMLDEHFRQDVFVRAEPVQVPRDPKKIPGLMDLRIGTLCAENEIEREVKVPAGTLRFNSEFHDRLIAKLCSGNHTVREFLDDPQLNERRPIGIARVIQLLMATGQIWPMAEAQPAVAADLATRDVEWELPSRWNKATITIAQRMEGGKIRCMAAPVAGTGLPLSTLEACILDGLVNAGMAGAVDYANKELERFKRLLELGGKTIARGIEQTKVLTDELELFRKGKLATLAKLNVIRPVARAAS